MRRWETRMRLKHYLDQGVSKAELSRRFGVSRRTIHRWIQASQLDRDLLSGSSGYSPRARRHALVAALGHSRLLWLRFYRRQAMAALTEGLESAFGRFGGVPRELLFDQMRAVALSDRRSEGDPWC